MAFEDDGLSLPPFPSSEAETDFKKSLVTKNVDGKEDEHRMTRVIALTGSCGGVGTTTLALQLAHEFTQQSDVDRTFSNGQARPGVCVIDLDFEAGGLANALDIPPSLNTKDLAQSDGKIDDIFMSAVTCVHASGFAVIASKGCLAGNRAVNPMSVLALMDVASQQFDTVILDVPFAWTPWSIPALAGADKTVIVTELTVPALKRAKLRHSELTDATERDDDISILLNKVERRTFRSGLKVRDAEKTFGDNIIGAVCVDGDLAQEAMNCGDPCGEIRSEARLVKDVRAVSEALVKALECENGLVAQVG